MASLADLVTQGRVWRHSSLICHELGDQVMRGSGNWSGCPPVMMMHWLQHNYPDNESLVCKQESVNFMMNPPSSHSLVSCGSDNNWPQNKIHRLHKEQNALHLRHHHLSKNQLWNRNNSFFLQHWKLFFVLSALWEDPGCQSPVFPLLISSDLTTRPIFLPHIQFYCFAAVRRKWNAPALIIIAPC